MTGKTQAEPANTPTDAANAPGAVSPPLGQTAEQVQEQAMAGGAYQVRQDVDGPLTWGGVGAFAPGATVQADHPGVAGWLEQGVLEPYVDPFTGAKSKVKKG
jgi:hypothetical protein